MYPVGFNTDDPLHCPVCNIPINDTDWSNFGDILIKQNQQISRTIVHSWYLNALDRQHIINITPFVFNKELHYHELYPMIMNGMPLYKFKIFNYGLQHYWKETHKVYFEDRLYGVGKYILFNYKNHWLKIKFAMKLLSLHHRAIVSANSPDRKFQRGEFDIELEI